MNKIEEKILITEFQNSIKTIGDTYEREFLKLNKQVAEIEPTIHRMHDFIKTEITSSRKEIKKHQEECKVLINSLGEASEELRTFLKDYDKEKIDALLKILNILQQRDDEKYLND